MTYQENNLNEKDKQAIDAAKLYYQSKQSQQEVAEQLGVSRPTVSKLLQHASEQGFVTIAIHDPRDTFAQLEACLKTRYQLSEVRICPTPIEKTREKCQQAIGELGARVLERLVHDGDIIGIEWSNTINALAKALQPQLFRHVEVVQLRGSEAKVHQGLNEAETISKICHAFNAKGQMLLAPIVFEEIKTKNFMLREQSIWRVLENGRKCRIAVFTVGSLEKSGVLFSSGYFSQEEMNTLLTRSVGGICARFVDEKGRICLPDLNSRTVGISLPDLRHKEERLLVAGGVHKVHVIHVALQYGYANRLVTDSVTAELLLSLN